MAPGPVRCVVDAAEAGQRLDRFLAARGFLPTRSRLAALVRAGHVRVDGVVRKASFPVPPGAEIAVELPPEEPSWVEPEAIELDVLHEDEAIVVVNKPPGMASHPAPGTRHGTLVAALLHRWNFVLDAWPDPARPGIVHRLDKDTSGVIVVAKSPQAMHALSRQFAARTVEKSYVAVVHGVPAGGTGTVDLPIGRDPLDRKKMEAREGQSRAAVTDWAVVRSFGGGAGAASLLRLRPRTGRTHQLRVHLATLGHPIVGDVVYGRARAGGAPSPDRAGARAPEARAVAALLGSFPRQALHAEHLRFRHPSTGDWLEVRAPLPRDIAQLLERLAALSPDAPAGRGGPVTSG